MRATEAKYLTDTFHADQKILEGLIEDTLRRVKEAATEGNYSILLVLEKVDLSTRDFVAPSKQQVFNLKKHRVSLGYFVSTEEDGKLAVSWRTPVEATK